MIGNLKPTFSVAYLITVLALLVLLSPAEGGRAAGAEQDVPGSHGAGVLGSGWQIIERGETLTIAHGMGGDPAGYAVQLWAADTDGDYGINSRAYGGLEDDGGYYGVAWQRLTGSNIQVYRHADDTLADMVAVWIWVPDNIHQNCSDWLAVTPGGSTTFAHNLGGNPANYVVGLWFRQNDAPPGETPLGVNQHGYGGLEDQGQDEGAYWYNLTDTGIQVARFAEDNFAQQVRVCVSVPTQPPDYDSGWVALAPGQLRTLDHPVGHNVMRYVVRMEFRDDGALGINNYGAGGNAIGGQYVGANWQNLTDQSIDVSRNADDQAADQVRVRIWFRKLTVSLPLVEKRYYR